MRGFLLASSKRGQEGVLAIKPHQDQQVRPVHHRHEARFHRHPVGVFDARGQAVNLDQVAADGARKVRQVGQRRDDADFGGMSGHRPATQYPGERDDREQTKQVSISC